MHPTISSRILTKLNGDSTLLSLFGIVTLDPANPPCFLYQRQTKVKLPSLTIKEGGRIETLFPGTDKATQIPDSFVSTNNTTLTVDLWISSDGGVDGALSPDGLNYPTTGDDANTIIQQVDRLLLLDTINWVQGTHGWKGASASQQYEVDTKIWHNVRRYNFDYHIMQGYNVD